MRFLIALTLFVFASTLTVTTLFSLSALNASRPSYVMTVVQSDGLYTYSPNGKQKWFIAENVKEPDRYYWLKKSQRILYINDKWNLMSSNFDGEKNKLLVKYDRSYAHFSISQPYIAPQGDRAVFKVLTPQGTKLVITNGVTIGEVLIHDTDVNALFWRDNWIYFNTDTHSDTASIYRLHSITHQQEYITQGILLYKMVNPFCGDYLVLMDSSQRGWSTFNTKTQETLSLPVGTWLDGDSYVITCLKEKWLLGINNGSQVFLVHMDGSDYTYITSLYGGNTPRILDWSLDEQWIYLSSFQGVIRVNINQREVVEMLYPFTFDKWITYYWWSKDKKKLLLRIDTQQNTHELVFIDTTGQPLSLYSSQENAFGAIPEPDLKWVKIYDNGQRFQLDISTQNIQELPKDEVFPTNFFEFSTLPLHWQKLLRIALAGFVASVGVKKVRLM